MATLTPKDPPMYGSVIREEKIDFWLTNGKSLLMIGRPGTAKTATCLEAFARNGLTLADGVAYWSPAHNDFEGDVHKANVVYFDEFSTPQAKLAALEIFGLRHWKGKPVPGIIWATLTLGHEDTGPEEEVFRRFDVTVEMPYRPHKAYFLARYGEKTARAAIEWWDALDGDTKKLISPRKLAEALDMWVQKGDIRDVLPVVANVSKLVTMINTGPVDAYLSKCLADNDKEEARNWLASQNNRSMAMNTIMSRPDLMAFCLPLLSPDVLKAALSADVTGVLTHHMIAASADVPCYHDVIEEVLSENVNKKLVKRIRKALTDKGA
jgi:hypothetical protein